MTDTTTCLDHPCTLSVSGWDIPAALTLPTAPESTLATAILLVPGSLFCDVNGDFPTWNSFPHVYAHLAHQFAARGHAVYRFAKLGPGTGSVATDSALAAAVRTWDGRLAIATAALEQMRRELDARGIRVGKTIAAGHSEGSVVVSRLGVSDAGRTLDGIVLLAGPSVGILEIMREQNRAMTPPSEVEQSMSRLDHVIDLVRREQPIPDDLKGRTMSGADALANMPDEARRYMRDVDATDPTATARQMTQPTLVVQGGNDSGVPTHHAERLRDALLRRANGSANTSYLFVPELTHMFKVVPPEASPQEAFGYPGETDPRVADGIDRWLRALPG